MLAEARQKVVAREDRYAIVIRRMTVALAAGIALMIGTFLYLLDQLRVSQRSREETERAKDQGRDRLAELEGVLDTVPAAVFIARDPDCRRMDGNRFAVEMMRASPGANLSLSAPREDRVPGVRFLQDGVELPPGSLPVQVAAFHGTPVEGMQMEIAFPDGTLRHLLGGARPLRDAWGALRGAVGAFVDVTEPVRMARDLR